MHKAEFERQLTTLIHKGYPEMAGMTADEFRENLTPLQPLAEALTIQEDDLQAGVVPFVLVVKGEWFDGEKAMQAIERKKKAGFSVMDAEEIRRFTPIEDIEIPTGMAYLMTGIDTGKETLNITPNDAMPILLEQQRSPLTLEEGIALITHFPDLVKKNNGFSLLGSRCGDRRVTAMWITENKPKLGWCWAGNPHTWLGSASCKARLGEKKLEMVLPLSSKHN
ncbi:DUF5701 family protein [Brevibacillus brevis]|uniref:DUF5701 family protein n=1 Tax=Brevibacillus brevis TaxID=1393 RepID=UPI001EDB4CDF|nr:DUF5701 family protein [Brevibacillus brevis]UKK97319.1 hypothetical protein FO446_07785 [Brevibacillus brevis]